MTTLREAAAMALDALEESEKDGHYLPVGVIEPLREALAQPAPEPFGYFQYSMHLDAWVQNKDEGQGVAFYTHPPQRKPLTDEEIESLADEFLDWNSAGIEFFARAIERAHGIGGEE